MPLKHKKILRCGTVVTDWSTMQIKIYIKLCKVMYVTLATNKYGPLNYDQMLKYNFFRQLLQSLIRNGN